MTDASMNTGTKAVGFTLMGSELVAMISDAKWLLVVIMACVLADFRYGWGESNKRYEQARSEGDKVGMHAFKWRTSRAVRRTVNKSVDYLIWVCLGMLVDLVILACRHYKSFIMRDTIENIYLPSYRVNKKVL